MAISFTEKTTVESSVTYNDQQEKEYNRTLFALSDEFIGEADVLLALYLQYGITIGFPYSSMFGVDNNAKCIAVQCTNWSDDSYSCDVQIRYGYLNRKDDEDPNDPISWRVRYGLDYHSFTEASLVDVQDTPFLNSAGEPFLAQEREVFYPIFEFTYNTMLIPEQTFTAYVNATNSDNWRGNKPGTVRFEPPRMAEQYHQSIGVYYEITVRFATYPKGWDWQLVDEGFNEKIGDILRPIVISNKPVEKPFPLDGNGRKGDPADQKKLTFRKYDRLPFKVWNF